MKFFETFESLLPQNLSSENATYVRATFGVALAYSAAMLNPGVTALVLLGHGFWEYAGFSMNPIDSIERRRIDTYNRAFDLLQEKAIELGSQCSKPEIDNARRIFFVHNLIEEIAYTALAEIVEKLDIKGDSITEEQSGLILAYVKQVAHKELRKPNGYTQAGKNMITEQQFSKVLENLATIIHDRDARLTDARYTSLLDLCIAIDDHNDYVKNVLFKSWFRTDKISSSTHLHMIKDMVGLNQRMSKQLCADFGEALKERKAYYDQHHGCLRQASCPSTGWTALRFVNISLVRATFKNMPEVLRELTDVHPSTPLITLFEQLQISSVRISKLTEPCQMECAPRFHTPMSQPPLLQKNLSVGEFLETYFPEVSKEKLESQQGTSKYLPLY